MTTGYSRSVIPPIELSTTFERETDGSYPGGYFYTRAGNPNRNQLEAELAHLEGGSAAACFASGMAATAAILQSLRTGDHVLLPSETYHGTQALLRDVYTRWGLAYTAVDMTDLAAVRSALRPTTRLIWLESPSNPRLRITDLERVVELARGSGALTVCDNTIASPVLQSPLRFGCDVVMHATTKALNGHSDVLGGVVICRDDGELAQRIRTVQLLGGGVPSPFDCWLLQRSLQTLPLRVQAQSASALQIAEFLAAHPAVQAVHYPGLASHPQHALAKKQMRQFGGLLSFEVHGGSAEALAMIAKLRTMRRATSLGGAETLVEHRASMEGSATLTPPSLVRVSVGLEPTADLLEDLKQALVPSPRESAVEED